MTLAYLGLGSNLDHPLAHVTRAVASLRRCDGITVQRVSPWYGSTAIGPGTQPDYVNGVVEIDTILDPPTLLHTVQQLEQQHGRTRETRWGARTLDIDILLYGDTVETTPALQIPHPRLYERRFVLQPLADLVPDKQIHCPDGVCPDSTKSATIAGLLQRLPDIGVWQLPLTG